MLLKESAEEAVSTAVEVGCNLLDTGEHYGNLELIGKGLAKAERKPFIITKLSGLPSGDFEAVRARQAAVNSQLGIDKADLCLIHWPGLCKFDPTDHGPLAEPSTFQEHISSFEEFCEHIQPAWQNMVRLQEAGLISHIGTSNFYPHHLAQLSEKCDGAVPFANEIFIDSTNQEQEFVAAMQAAGTMVLAYRPLMYNHGRFSDQVNQVAEAHSSSPQTVVLAWMVARGVYPLVKCRGDHITQNINGASELAAKLTEDQMNSINGSAGAGLKSTSEWFAKIWGSHNETGVSEDDVQMLMSMGVEEAKARSSLEEAGGNLDLAMEKAFS